MSDFLYNDSELQMDTVLILCIEEVEQFDSHSPIDTRLFIGWDEQNNDYFIRGKRQDTRKTDFVPFAFSCKSSNTIYDFIKFTMSTNRVNIIVYNFNNISYLDSHDLPYDLFESQMDKNYEIAGYDNVSLKRSRIVNYLKMLKNTYNWDES
jgi:hypothetical protein